MVKANISQDKADSEAIKAGIASPDEINFYSPINDKQGNVIDVKINYTKFYELLKSLGFYRFDIANDFIMVKVKNNIVEQVTCNIIQDVFFEYLNWLPDILNSGIPKELLIEKFNKSPENYFSLKRLTRLKKSEDFSFMVDSKDSAYIFFNNGFVECQAKKWEFKDYNQLTGYIWKNQILNRDFHYRHIMDIEFIQDLGIFAQFMWNISGKDKLRMGSLCSMVGYLLHSFNEGKLKALILTDSCISESPNGRTGKSLFIRSVAQMKTTAIIKGKDFEPSDAFKYGELNIDSQIVALDDVRDKFNFECMFNDITEGIRVNKKNQQPFTIKPKIIISTNRTIKIDGASAIDRSLEFELADHYNDKYSPVDEFGKWFFGTDFDSEDWIQFDNFMMYCISLYMESGLVAAEQITLDQRKLIEATCYEFVEFMETLVRTKKLFPGGKYCKQDLHDQFLHEYPEFAKNHPLMHLRTFTAYLKLFARYTSGFAEITKQDESKSGSKRFILFRPA